MPKFLVNADGSLGERNPVGPGSIRHKMGIKASATCVMNFDAAKGYLVGKENEGLAAMFVMMNYERLSMGIKVLVLLNLLTKMQLNMRLIVYKVVVLLVLNLQTNLRIAS